jgi:hypothetical protein
MRRHLETLHGRQVGDPQAAADRIVELVDSTRSSKIPLRLALGRDSLENQRKALREALASLDEWESVSLSTDFAPGL